MSKIRQNIAIDDPAAPVESRPTGDAKPYVIFTQMKENGPHIYAGWLEAVDDAMAIVLAKEHYGQDQECVNIWAIARESLTSSDGLYAADSTRLAATRSRRLVVGGGASPSYRIFTQKRAGDVFLEAGEVEAETVTEAIDRACAKPQAAKAHCLWVVPAGKIVSTAPGEMIWRSTDQTYRLARGYTRDVKEKWQRFRGEEALKEYEKEDLKESF